MIGAIDISRIGQGLAALDAPGAPGIWDVAIDADDAVSLAGDDALLDYARHQALLRAYQSRYVLLPDAPSGGDIVEQLRRRYQPGQMAALEQARRVLEDELISPAIEAARTAAAGTDWHAYAEALVVEVRQAQPGSLIAFLRGNANRESHYRNFLVQSSADLLAEASASALGVVGEFGPAQSALFRILIDEFGYGVHDRKHSVLFRAVMRGFGVSDEYNACWRLFDTSALRLHNTIHALFQNPGHLFLQVGFLLHAETAYQRSTLDHFRYLSEFHPDIDARYFGEHAHIDLHHTRMVIEEVAAPLVATHGPRVGEEMVAGAELTRQAFSDAGESLLGISLAFEEAHRAGRANFRFTDLAELGAAVTPSTAKLLADRRPVQVGGLGVVEAGAFIDFPAGAIGRTLSGERS